MKTPLFALLLPIISSFSKFQPTENDSFDYNGFSPNVIMVCDSLKKSNPTECLVDSSKE